MIPRWCQRIRRTLVLGLMIPAGMAMADQPAELLKRMADAAHDLHYEGTLVEIRDGEVETFSVIHRADEGGGRERIFSLSGGARELVRDHDSVRCVYGPDSRDDVDLRQLAARMEVDDLRGLDSVDGELYRFRILGEDRMAARPARVVTVEPRDSLRYGFRFWVDAENDMPLRSDLIHPDGTVLEQIMFTRISYPETIGEDRLAPRLNSDGNEMVTRHARLDHDELAGESARLPGGSESGLEALPAGFELVTVDDKQVGHRSLRHLVFSDGLAQISVFIEPHDNGDRVLEGERRMGAVSAFGQRVEGQRVTVVGEVPMDTVRGIARVVERLLPRIQPPETGR